jgi:hypothetical protein
MGVADTRPSLRPLVERGRVNAKLGRDTRREKVFAHSRAKAGDDSGDDNGPRLFDRRNGKRATPQPRQQAAFLAFDPENRDTPGQGPAEGG